MVATVVLLQVVGWGMLLTVVVPGRFASSEAVFGAGLGLTAYTLGVRHAFDADHIAAIDNTTRKLVAENRKPLSVGFWFSLGHSSVVFVMVLALAFGVRALASGVRDEHSRLHTYAGILGSGISGTFLLLIALLNLVSLFGIGRALRAQRRGHYDETALDALLETRGAINRLLSPLVRGVREPRHMYPIGLLFGLGFDTVTEVSLLVLAGGAATGEVPWYAILVLPVLFSAGMTLFDSLDGAYMSYAYGWAFAEPRRKIYYNLVVTGLSVLVALLIGGQQIVSVVAERLRITSGPVAWIGNMDLGSLGFAIAALFLGVWLLAVATWRYRDAKRTRPAAEPAP
ncbi:HoxN/HupN/NixA family nickel/cobalt transporter [Nocardia stercoris]|uniref:Nickel/cobalt efflux system n=2 Tax=Nocardia stercoris TaxID=2483361 RepID=A0A3M2KVC5_9NOCA|nr:HoxN/HupN/NixA family nickel/cobalt transporter [Nocardia stercoris]